MDTKTTIFKSIRWGSVAGMIGVIIVGFVFPISIFQGFIVNPIILLSLMASYGYADIKLDSKDVSTEIHLLPLCSVGNNHYGKKSDLSKKAA